MKSSTIVIVHTYVCVKNLPLIKITMVRKKCPITGLFITLSQQNRLLHFSTLSSHYMLLSSSHKTVDSVTNFMHLFLPQNVSKKVRFLPLKFVIIGNQIGTSKKWLVTNFSLFKSWQHWRMFKHWRRRDFSYVSGLLSLPYFRSKFLDWLAFSHFRLSVNFFSVLRKGIYWFCCVKQFFVRIVYYSIQCSQLSQFPNQIGFMNQLFVYKFCHETPCMTIFQISKIWQRRRRVSSVSFLSGMSLVVSLTGLKPRKALRKFISRSCLPINFRSKLLLYWVSFLSFVGRHEIKALWYESIFTVCAD